MRPTLTALARMAGLLLGGTLAVVADAQQQKPNKLEYDSTPGYQERSVTPPAAAVANASDALKTRPGKEPAQNRPNGLGFDSGAASMSKKQ